MSKSKDEDEFDDEKGSPKFDHLMNVGGEAVVPEIVESDDESHRIRSRISEISQRVDEDRIELGSLFFRVRHRALYVRWHNPTTGRPYESWEEYVLVESSFSTRSIQHMMSMWWWFSSLSQFPQIRQLIHEVGWKKARLLVGLVDDENYQAWFEQAKVRPFDKLNLLANAAKDKVNLARRPSPSHDRPNPNGILPTDVASVLDPKASAPTGEGEVAVVDGGRIVDTDPVSTTISSAKGATATEPDGEDGSSEATPAETRKGVAVPTAEEESGYRQKKIPWKAMVDADQAEHVDKAVMSVWDHMVEAGTLTKRPTHDDTGRGLALEMMATHFMSFYSGAAAPTKEMRNRRFFTDIMKGLEKNFGLMLIAIDKKGDFVHGLAEDIYEAVERKLGVDIVVFKKDTNRCVYGYDTVQRVGAEEIQDEDEPNKD